jgi:mannose-1-phosphate guanylyltransferase
MPVDNILAEPEARNTAPCIAYACWKIQKKHPDTNIVVTPSDALVINTSEYQRVLSKALSYTSDKNAIVTIGIKPGRPKTGYGYIAAAGPTSVDEIYKVEAFKEKPNLETAEQYLAVGNYYWNAGIFVWNIDTISKAIRTFQPNLASIMDEMAPSFYTEQEKRGSRQTHPNLREDQYRLCRNGEVEGNLYLASRVWLERLRQLG